MTHIDPDQSRPAGHSAGGAEALKSTVQSDIEAAKARVADVADDVKQSARHAAATAKDEVIGGADRQKDAGASHIDEFASAVRAAADDLGRNDKSIGAQFLGEAAGGLESISSSLREKSVGEIVDTVSRFGRSNPTAFLGGALLAGIALGRFAKASGEREAERPSSDRSGGDDHPTNPGSSTADMVRGSDGSAGIDVSGSGAELTGPPPAIETATQSQPPSPAKDVHHGTR